MEIIVYITTAIITIIWSVWIHNLWSERAKLREDSAFRFFLIVLPSTFFLLIAFSGWQGKYFLRVDLIGLILLNVVTILVAVILLVMFRIERNREKKVFTFGLILYFLLGVGTVASVYIIKAFPILMIKLGQFISEGRNLDLNKTLWGVVNPEKHEEDLSRAIDKILIALFTYVPIAIARFFYTRRQFKRINEELSKIKREIKVLKNSDKSV